jgi:hypothetical protein
MTTNEEGRETFYIMEFEEGKAKKLKNSKMQGNSNGKKRGKDWLYKGTNGDRERGRGRSKVTILGEKK